MKHINKYLAALCLVSLCIPSIATPVSAATSSATFTVDRQVITSTTSEGEVYALQAHGPRTRLPSSGMTPYFNPHYYNGKVSCNCGNIIGSYTRWSNNTLTDTLKHADVYGPRVLSDTRKTGVVVGSITGTFKTQFTWTTLTSIAAKNFATKITRAVAWGNVPVTCSNCGRPSTVPEYTTDGESYETTVYTSFSAAEHNDTSYSTLVFDKCTFQGIPSWLSAYMSGTKANMDVQFLSCQFNDVALAQLNYVHQMKTCTGTIQLKSAITDSIANSLSMSPSLRSNYWNAWNATQNVQTFIDNTYIGVEVPASTVTTQGITSLTVPASKYVSCRVAGVEVIPTTNNAHIRAYQLTCLNDTTTRHGTYHSVAALETDINIIGGTAEYDATTTEDCILSGASLERNTRLQAGNALTATNITSQCSSLRFSGNLVDLRNCELAGTSTTISAGNSLLVDKSRLNSNATTIIVTGKDSTNTIKGTQFNSRTSMQTANSATLTLNNCIGSQDISTGGAEVIIDGGTYSGSPAVTGSNVTVKRGTFTDNSGTSQFLIDPDSEATVTTSGTKTVTTVKLTNPPIIIDWGDFPGIDLDIDLAAPVIEVLRNPSDNRTPTNQVTLTIRATDPNGHDDPKPISINGGAFQASPATFTCTENQIVSIIARDANGNTREYQATIANIDSQPPEVLGFSQSVNTWTKDFVKVYVEAQDDVKLNLTPYKFEFIPNSGAATVTTGWQADRSFKATENGTLYCTVRDAMGKETKSDPYYVRNIDNVAPTATYTLSPPAGVKASPNSGVTIELAIQNTGDPVTEEASALSTTAVKWSDTEAWSEDLRRTVYENGTYNIRVRDSVGNVSNPIPITVANINTDKPVIDSLTGTHLTADYVQAPVTLSVEAHGGASTPLAEKAYSWDGGTTWTSLKDYKVYNNGEYTVKVRDETGTMVEASIIVSNIDAVKPTASVYLFKGLPADGTGEGPDDYVWKIRVEADDIGSGIDHIETLWDGGTHTSMPIIQDVAEPGVYGIIVYDKAGNQTYAEKTVTAESIGESTGTNNNAYVDIKVPSGGSAGSHFGASLGDLIYGPTGAYNKATDSFKTYQSGAEGITCNIVATAKNGTWLTGYATFNSVKYPVTFGGADGVRGGKNIEASVYIPISGITTDVRNGRLVLVLQEWDNSSKTTLKREGSATLYTSVQVNSPKINYTYNKATDEMTLVATSAVAGIQSSTYDVGSGDVAYTAPFHVNGASKITLTAVDKCQNVTSIELDGTTLPVAGEGGGMLPTEGITEDGVNSYYIAGRSSESYIIGGTRSNTENVPSSSVFDAILGTTP